MPAAAIGQIDGETYLGVPREVGEPRYVMDNALAEPGKPRLRIHALTPGGYCSVLRTVDPGVRVTPIASAADARTLLVVPDATGCQACHPDP